MMEEGPLYDANLAKMVADKLDKGLAETRAKLPAKIQKMKAACEAGRGARTPAAKAASKNKPAGDDEVAEDDDEDEDDDEESDAESEAEMDGDIDDGDDEEEVPATRKSLAPKKNFNKKADPKVLKGQAELLSMLKDLQAKP